MNRHWGHEPMNVRTRLIRYAAMLVAVFALALALGWATAPDAPQPEHHPSPTHEGSHS